MDFSISPEIEALARAYRRVRRARDPAARGGPRHLRRARATSRCARSDALRAKAQAEGLWCLQLKPETGGRGLGKIGMAVCYEEMNRSIFGPVVFNSAAPDDGNMMVLEALGTPDAEGALARSRSSTARSAPPSP